ncbi:hypothetical protein Nepgr_011755 [Nepenthes gracilis]|uniref:Uncharacterized protein n=1 Tax=Nepenthes gracilis TaxID=150966 RepID=A0AAD3XMK3_NEPGR|nr:hypothetical protein Nepgr_011755 [Nepenthes gracilis]
MPQVDLVVVYGGSLDRKITCETLENHDPTAADLVHKPDPPPDYAPDSFRVSKDAELDWIDRNAFIERKDSAKGNSNSHSANLNPNQNSVSLRYSVKSRASIIGLPKPQKTNYADSNFRRSCRPPSVRLFPKRSETVSGKSTVSVTEPSSPKVSCMGRVRSTKDRSRRMRKRRNQPEPVMTKTRSLRKPKVGFWTNFRSMFLSRSHKPAEKSKEQPKESPMARKSRSVKKREFSATPSETPSEAPSLGAVKRFASGRRSDAWAGELDVDGAKSRPLDGASI